MTEVKVNYHFVLILLVLYKYRAVTNLMVERIICRYAATLTDLLDTHFRRHNGEIIK